MISRNSFFKLLKEDLKQRLWTIILAAIVLILPVPIYIAMIISGASGYGSWMQDSFAARLATPMASDSFWLMMVTIVGALICAVSGFGYLFSRKKVDFFHSLPVKRETLFAVRYINGVLIYLVPYLVMLLASILIIAISGNLEVIVFKTAFQGLMVHLLGYLTVYTTFVLCVTFVGNMVVFFAVSVWTFGITLVTVLVYSWFEDTFFDTFSYLGDVYTERIHSLRFLCPGYFYVMEVQNLDVSLLLQQLAFTVVVSVLTLLVYRMRPSDGAGKAIAFPILKPVIRVSVELLAGALMGMMFFNLADNLRSFPGWMLFGIVLGVVLSHMLIQSIFYFDVRKCFAEKWSMFACVAVTVAFSMVMRYDAFGYDMYLPKAKKIESVAIEMPNLDSRRSSYLYDGKEICWIEEVNEMELTDVSGIYSYLETLVEDSGRYADAVNEGEVFSYNDFVTVNVAYHLKNGKTVYRHYVVEGIREDLFAPVFESDEYKEVHYGDIYTIPSDFITAVSARCAMNTCEMDLSQSEKEELMTVLRRELSALTLAEKLHTRPVALLELTAMKISARDNYGNYYTSNMICSNELPIYASFTETLRFLSDRGFVANCTYEFTGKEAMRVRLPEVVDEDSSEWSKEYGDNVIPVDPEDFERLYELCIWELLFEYGDPTENYYETYGVFLDVPREGYNRYETFDFVIPRDTDLSFLFD